MNELMMVHVKVILKERKSLMEPTMASMTGSLMVSKMVVVMVLWKDQLIWMGEMNHPAMVHVKVILKERKSLMELTTA